MYEPTGYACPDCGGDLYRDRRTGDLACSHCDLRTPEDRFAGAYP